MKRMIWWVVVASIALAVWNGLGHDPRAWKANLVTRSAEANVWAHGMAATLGLPTDGLAPSWSKPVVTTPKKPVAPTAK